MRTKLLLAAMLAATIMTPVSAQELAIPEVAEPQPVAVQAGPVEVAVVPSAAAQFQMDGQRGGGRGDAGGGVPGERRGGGRPDNGEGRGGQRGGWQDRQRVDVQPQVAQPVQQAPVQPSQERPAWQGRFGQNGGDAGQRWQQRQPQAQQPNVESQQRQQQAQQQWQGRQNQQGQGQGQGQQWRGQQWQGQRDQQWRNRDSNGFENRRFDDRRDDQRRDEQRRVEQRGFEQRGFDNRGFGQRGFEQRRFEQRGFDNRGFGNRGFNQSGNWNRDWRRDQRYDWQRYRSVNRDFYRGGRYYAPYGWSYGYRRFSIGISLSNILFDQRYWIEDPYAYRLPPAYGAYRWVRYYDDVLLVDLRTGEVVDAIYDFFW